MRYCFVFVCQQGELEIKSLLLAASLKRHLRCDYELIAAIPGPESLWGTPSPLTLQQMNELGVRCQGIENQINRNYPIGNKVSCLDVQTDADKLVFLDSDILCSRDFYDHDRFKIPFNSKPADESIYSMNTSDCARVYKQFGLRMPEQRVITTFTLEATVPYFNAGMIAVHRELGFGKEWAQICKQIDADPEITNKRPWLDQIGLMVTLTKMGVDYDCLTDDYNYPLHMKSIRGESLPYFCHYHDPATIRREPKINQLFFEIVDEHPSIKKILTANDKWAPFIRPFKVTMGSGNSLGAKKRDGTSSILQDGVITGIPRSGTSYLCTLLNKVKDCVAINEPDEIFPILGKQKIPWGMMPLYRQLRRLILDGQTVKNKLLDGAPIEDTAKLDQREGYIPDIDSENFALFTKNTLAYSFRITDIKRVMPDASIVACVRNPYDTIASWKESFPHLKSADVNQLPFGGLNNPFQTGFDRFFLMYSIAPCENEAVRRALLWRFLAEKVIAHKNDITIIRYEDIVATPEKILHEILGKFTGGGQGFQVPAIEKSSIRSKRQNLTRDDIIAISSVCAEPAYELGYDDVCLRDIQDTGTPV